MGFKQNKTLSLKNYNKEDHVQTKTISQQHDKFSHQFFKPKSAHNNKESLNNFSSKRNENSLKPQQLLCDQQLKLNISSRRNDLNNLNKNNVTAMQRLCQPSLVTRIARKSKRQQIFKNKWMNVTKINILNINNNTGLSMLKVLRCKGRLVPKVKMFLIEFLQDSSIHGFGYLAKFGLSLIERTLWFAFICLAIFSIISLSHRTWQRFQNSPMVISMDRNKLAWNTSFPSLTVCPHKRIDELKLEDYVASHPEIFPNEEDVKSFRDFIENLAQLSYDNIEHLPLNGTFAIKGDKYLDLLYELKWQFEPQVSSGAAFNMFVYETQTEFGTCLSVNSLVARYNSYEYWKSNEWGLLDHGERLTVHPLDGEIYAQIVNLSTAYDVYFHSANDIPSIAKQHYTFPDSDYATVELTALEIYTDEAAKAFSTKQRKCRFKYEAEEMLTVPIYSYGLCLAECRLFLALRICRCVPHFYRNTLRNGRILPICGLKGLACVAEIKNEMITLKSKRYKIDCKCLGNCDDSNYFVQSYRTRTWFLGANLQWGIVDYPKMQLRRDVIFSFADVLVYMGGLVGFFLGCSALSFMEIIYYFTVRFAKRLMS